jgi:hypothetical protein
LFWSIISVTGNVCLEILITFIFHPFMAIPYNYPSPQKNLNGGGGGAYLNPAILIGKTWWQNNEACGTKFCVKIHASPLFLSAVCTAVRTSNVSFIFHERVYFCCQLMNVNCLLQCGTTLKAFGPNQSQPFFTLLF